MASTLVRCHSYLPVLHTHTHTFDKEGKRELQLGIEHLKPSWLPCHAVGVCVCVWEETVWQWLLNRQLASLFLVVPQLISQPFVCCLYASVYERPPSKSHLSWLWYTIVCVCKCAFVCMHVFVPWPRPWWVPRHRGWVSLCPGFHGSCWLY